MKRIDAETEFDKRNGGDKRGKTWLSRVLQDLNMVFNPWHDWFNYGDMDSKVNNLVSSVENQITKEGLTGAEREANAFNAEEAQKSRDFTEYMARNKYSIESASMQDAGVNPAMVYGGGNLVSTSANGAQASSVAPSGAGGILPMMETLMTFARMPLELKRIGAEIENTRANAALTRQKTETEKFETQIRGINAGYADELGAQNLANLKASYENTVADTDYKTANRDYVLTQKEAQSTLNKYLDERQREEIRNLKQSTEKMSAEEKKTKAEKVYQDWYNGFVKANGFLPSSNDTLMLATYIASLFGIAKEDVSSFMDNLMEEVGAFVQGKPRNERGKGGNTSASGGSGASGSSEGGNSR